MEAKFRELHCDMPFVSFDFSLYALMMGIIGFDSVPISARSVKAVCSSGQDLGGYVRKKKKKNITEKRNMQ